MRSKIKIWFNDLVNGIIFKSHDQPFVESTVLCTRRDTNRFYVEVGGNFYGPSSLAIPFNQEFEFFLEKGELPTALIGGNYVSCSSCFRSGCHKSLTKMYCPTCGGFGVVKRIFPLDPQPVEAGPTELEQYLQTLR